jgi:hypothetical protein
LLDSSAAPCALGYVFLIASAVVGVAHLAGISWPLVALAAAGLHFVIALVLLLVARNRITRPLFRTTLAELKKDREWLKNLDATNRRADGGNRRLTRCVGRGLRGLHYELDFPAKLRRSLRKKEIYVGAESGRKTKKKLAETGFALGALNIGASLIRPAIAGLVKNRLTRTVGGARTRSR